MSDCHGSSSVFCLLRDCLNTHKNNGSLLLTLAISEVLLQSSENTRFNGSGVFFRRTARLFCFFVFFFGFSCVAGSRVSPRGMYLSPTTGLKTKYISCYKINLQLIFRLFFALDLRSINKLEFRKDFVSIFIFFDN